MTDYHPPLASNATTDRNVPVIIENPEDHPFAAGERERDWHIASDDEYQDCLTYWDAYHDRWDSGTDDAAAAAHALEVLRAARTVREQAVPAPTATAEPNGCRWCGVGEREHASRFAPAVGQHRYDAPTSAQRLARMQARQVATTGPVPLTAGPLATVRALTEAATPGPWKRLSRNYIETPTIEVDEANWGSEGHAGYRVHTVQDEGAWRDADIEFMARARQVVPALTAILERLLTLAADADHDAAESAASVGVEPGEGVLRTSVVRRVIEEQMALLGAELG